MALTKLQRTICKLIADNRVASGESYVAGGVALNTATDSSRISRDIDLFHDSVEAVSASWIADRDLLVRNGFDVAPAIERPGYVEATVRQTGESVLMQWTSDSAFRFFPLISHEDFGLTLHPFDLATNKVLALVGRLEVRDWVDVISCHERIQRLGYLAWAASSKDLGFSPAKILDQAGRSSRYSTAEVEALEFEGAAPSAEELAGRWHDMLHEARELVRILPPSFAGQCVLHSAGDFFNGDAAELKAALDAGHVLFHRGCLRGAYPTIVSP